MHERTAIIASRSGLHARPAALFAESAGNRPLT
nr:HPr family phosphocarrier protein [Arthrobacter sp. SF27]